MKLSESAVIFDMVDNQYGLEKVCAVCGSDRIELLGCHYVCLRCGNAEGCSD